MKTKRILAIILSVAMLFGTFGISALAKNSTVEVSNPEDLKTALINADNDLIVLKDNITLGNVYPSNAYTPRYNLATNSTIDLNGKTLTLTWHSYCFQNTTTTFKNGTIVVATGANNDQNGVFCMYGDSNLIFDNVTVTTTETKSDNSTEKHLLAGSYFITSNNGSDSVTIKNKSVFNIDGTTSSDKKFYALVSFGSLTIDDSKFESTGTKRGFFDCNVTLKSAEVKLQTSDEGIYREVSHSLVVDSSSTLDATVKSAGTITPGYTTEEGIFGEAETNATKSVEIKLFSNEKEIAKTSLNNVNNIISGKKTLVTFHFYFTPTADEYWTGNSFAAKLAEKPTKVELYVDGTKVAEKEVQMNFHDNLRPVEWDNLAGVSAPVKIGTKGYLTLEDAVKNAKDGDTIILYEDLNGNGIVIDKDLSIDLNGHTYTVDGNLVSSVPGKESIGFQILKGSGEETIYVNIMNGKIVASQKAIPGNGFPETSAFYTYKNGVNMLIQNYSNLYLYNVELYGNEAGENGIFPTSYVLSNNNGDILIKDSKIVAPDGKYAFDIYADSRYDGTKVTVENSTIEGLIEISGDSETEHMLISGENTYTDFGEYVQSGNSFKRVYTLTFETDGGREVESVKKPAGETINLTPYSTYKDGYRFLSWCADKELKNKVNSITLDEDKTVYAKYAIFSNGNGGSAVTVKKYTVSFETNGAGKISSKQVTKNLTVKEPTAPTRDGYKFAGWYSDKDLTVKYDFSKAVTKSFTLYAKWDKEDSSSDPEVNKNQIILTIGKLEAVVFGEKKTNDVAPMVANNRTMLPARFVAENLGADVSWDADTQTVIITGKHLKTGEDITVKMTIGEKKALVNDEELELDSPAFVANNRTYSPIRFFAEALGADVSWDADTQSAIITK